MKKLQLATLLAISFLSFSSLFANAIEGVWVSDRQQKKIIIKQYDRELFVRGVYPKYERGQVFRRTSRTKYRDAYGNLIKIADGGIIQVRYVNTTNRINFRRLSHQVPRVNRNQSCAPPRSNRNSGIDRQDRDRNNRGIAGLEGTWFNRDINQEVCIIADRYGIKAAIRRGEWTYFEQLDQNTYRDNRGNTYTVNRDGTMSWVSHDRTRVFDLVKRSNTIPY